MKFLIHPNSVGDSGPRSIFSAGSFLLRREPASVRIKIVRQLLEQIDFLAPLQLGPADPARDPPDGRVELIDIHAPAGTDPRICGRRVGNQPGFALGVQHHSRGIRLVDHGRGGSLNLSRGLVDSAPGHEHPAGRQPNGEHAREPKPRPEHCTGEDVSHWTFR